MIRIPTVSDLTSVSLEYALLKLHAEYGSLGNGDRFVLVVGIAQGDRHDRGWRVILDRSTGTGITLPILRAFQQA